MATNPTTLVVVPPGTSGTTAFNVFVTGNETYQQTNVGEIICTKRHL